jgi:hypothetical protein
MLQKMGSDTLKNAIESADYYPDSRARRQHHMCYLKKVYSLFPSGFGASTMAKGDQQGKITGLIKTSED